MHLCTWLRMHVYIGWASSDFSSLSATRCLCTWRSWSSSSDVFHSSNCLLGLDGFVVLTCCTNYLQNFLCVCMSILTASTHTHNKSLLCISYIRMLILFFFQIQFLSWVFYLTNLIEHAYNFICNYWCKMLVAFYLHK